MLLIHSDASADSGWRIKIRMIRLGWSGLVWGQSHKTFRPKFTYSFRKLDIFIHMQQILHTVIEWSSYKKV